MLQQELKLRAAHLEPDELLEMLGYRRPVEKHRQRLSAVLHDPMLGLRRSAFDFRYGNRAFIQALASVLGVNEAFAKGELLRIRELIERAETEFVPTLWVDTGFKRTTQPLFALAACEHQRTITFDAIELNHYRQLTMSQRVRWIASWVREHYQHHEGQLGIWGVIQRYVYCYEPGAALAIRPDGSVEKEMQPPSAPGARLSVRGKAIALNRNSEAV